MIPVDDRGLDDLCHRLHPQLVGALTILCRDRHVAEELAQETLVRVYERWGHVRTLERPEAWAHRVAVNLARSWWRRRWAERRAYARHGTTDDTCRDSSDQLHHDDRQAVHEGLAALSPRQRTVLAYRYWLELSIDETAVVMGCRPGTVKSHTHKALQALRSDGGQLGRLLAEVPSER